MKRLVQRWFGAALLSVAATGATQADSVADRVAYVTFQTLHRDKPLSEAGRFVRPGKVSESKIPAIVLLHGSSGPSAREEGYQAAFARAGIASISIDEWTPRGVNGPAGRPKSVMETLPDAYGALAWLRAQPEIDPERIGVMGFSFGAVATMLAATRKYDAEHAPPGGGFKAFAPVYPICWMYGRVPGYDFADLAGGPVLIITGGADQYDNDPEACAKLVAKLPPADQAKVRTLVLSGAHHAFDKPGEDQVANDPMGHQGKGGGVIMRHDPAATERSTQAAVAFFTEVLGGQ